MECLFLTEYPQYAKQCAIAFALLVLTIVPTLAQGVPEGFIIHDSPRNVPQVTFEDASGAQRNLSAFTGKVVLLNLWATWCGPCRKEMPTLDRLQHQLGGPGFEVVALSVDHTGMDAVRKFYASIGIVNLAAYNDPTVRATGTLGTFGLPTTLLLNRAGAEIGRYIGPAEWDDQKMVAFIAARVKAESSDGAKGTSNP